MSDRIDYMARAAESVQTVAALLPLGATDRASVVAAAATAEAMLALVEQQRIANMLAYYASENTPPFGAHAEIREALGLQ